MSYLLLTVLAIATTTWSSGIAVAKPTSGDVSIADAIVEIVRQKLVKFPDELSDQRNATTTNGGGSGDDEARRILAQIEKVNQALGYVKKQAGGGGAAGESQPKMPPLLDSSQYLFPKPAYHPFHEHSHQMAGAHGATLLVPSIRALPFIRDAVNYNVPPPFKLANLVAADEEKDTSATSSRPPTPATPSVPTPPTPVRQYYFRPHQVHVPAPQTAAERAQLPTHFVLPVQLYKQNKEAYVRERAPLEYRVKGYKIVGDIDHFYGKTKGGKRKHGVPGGAKAKHTPKYHLFFLPRELVLNESGDSYRPPAVAEASGATLMPAAQLIGREEKLTNRPFKVQTTASTSSTHKNGTVGSSPLTAGVTQVIRKRIVPKPLREKESLIESVAAQTLPTGGQAVSSTSIRITPAPLGINTLARPAPAPATQSPPQVATAAAPDTSSQQMPTGNANKLGNNFGLFGFNNRNSSSTSNNATNAIKTAFQNIFKFPFRPDTQRPSRPIGAADFQSVPLQQPTHQTSYFSAQQLLPPRQQQLYVPAQPVYQMVTQQHNSNQDYKWDDENNSNSNSAATDDDETNDPDSAAGGAIDGASSSNSAEEKIFGHHHKQQQSTQREAIKQGGIIIQRLKVRKGGIAIAGPGGVATAGSGGTAIVGPGGYALTHPRSLTIAGPGAKVIAIPAHVDLQDALQRTNLEDQTFPREGRIVATGPTVYYAPGTGEGTGDGTGEGAVAVALQV